MKLIIEDDEGRKTVVPVVRDEISIGRGEDSLVRLTEKNVSRKHARFLRDAGHYYIEDLKSFTGVRVNGEKVTGRCHVQEGDLIQISEYDISLQAGPDDKKAPLGDDDEPTLVPPARQEMKPVADPAAEAFARKNAETGAIRLSDIGMQPAEDEAPVDIPPQQQPKLVCVSGALRGKEYKLAKSPTRIGRSEGNELEIDHPSISRKHCRLHFDKDVWKVLDAESKNGVRVNGDPYAAIGLRHGDILEIGHLKFAFVAPGQAYAVPAQTPATGTAKVASSKGVLYAIGAAVVVVAVAAALLLRGHKGSSSDNDGVEVAQDSRAERKFALRSADEAVAGHRYTEALRNLDVARRAGATAAELRSYEQVKAESRSEDLFREMESAASSQDWERARKILNVLTDSKTYYGAKAAQKADSITAGYVNLHVAAAALMKGKDNAGCLAEAQAALAANPQSADAQSLVDACKGPAPKPAVAASSMAPSKPAPAPAPVADDSEARRLLNDGDQKLVSADIPGALASYQAALALKPGDGVLRGLYRSMGIAFTKQGNMEEGARYYKLYLPLCTNPAEKAQLQKVLDDYEARRRG